MSACSFVQTELKKKEPLKDEKCLTQMREDVGIVDNALKFVNDLLRNMLDMHRGNFLFVCLCLACLPKMLIFIRALDSLRLLRSH